MKFRKLDVRVDLPELEEKVLEYWKSHDVVQKYLKKNKSSDKKFSFIDGPVTANNPMGVHHARGRSLKDLIQRYKNMQGFEQRFQNGFDCQGLWVEVEVEKALGFNSKKDIEEYGLGEFTNACKDRVVKYAEKITEQSKRLGYFMDWDNSYFTFSERNNLHIWHFLKKCFDKGLIYKDKSAVAWCPRCETGLSKHEQVDGYQTITDESVYVKFPLEGKKNEYFLVWTTTPWTLSSNVLLAVNPSLEYVRVQDGEDILYLEKESAERLGLGGGESIDVKELVEQRYVPPYSEIEVQKDVDHYVVEWDEVAANEGTGIVHIAPGGGEDDFLLGKRLGAPVISPLDERGIFGDGFGELSGMYAHDVNDSVKAHLKSKGLLFRTENVTHSYPHCWRCKTKCLFRLEDNWFIDTSKIKEDMKKAADKTKWQPEFTSKRMQDWLENMGDWMISRRRFYGLSLPFYECKKCNELMVAGSKEELKSMAINPEKVETLPSLHRPWIDEIEVKCKCGEIVQRVPEVGDCWLDAGVVPFSTLNYLSDKAYWKKWFPADLVSEMVEQVRLWYYSMLVHGVVLENVSPYNLVVSYDEVRDENGDRMSKSKGNGIPYDEAVSKMGADAMRWLYFGKNPSSTVNFGYSLTDKIKKGFFGTLWNCHRFFLGYAPLETSPEALQGEEWSSDSDLDKWIVSKLETLVKEVTDVMDEYNPSSATKLIDDFVVKELSLWYLRRSRDRIGPSAPDGKDKSDCYKTFWKVLTTVDLLLAPFIPFISEKLWYSLGVSESVHLEDWPKSDRRRVDEELEKEMELVREIVSMGHSLRKESEIKTRQPLSDLFLQLPHQEIREELLNLLKAELNIKEVSLFDKLDLSDESEWIVKGDDELSVALKIVLTPELKKEGLRREVLRKIQGMRKKAELTPEDRVNVLYVSDNSLLVDILSDDSLKNEVITDNVFQKDEITEEVLIDREFEIGDAKIHIALSSTR